MERICQLRRNRRISEFIEYQSGHETKKIRKRRKVCGVEASWSMEIRNLLLYMFHEASMEQVIWENQQKHAS